MQIVWIIWAKQKRARYAERLLLFILDANAVHHSERFLEVLRDLDVSFLFIPAGMAGVLQPLGLTANDKVKQTLHRILAGIRAHYLIQGVPMPQVGCESQCTQAPQLAGACQMQERTYVLTPPAQTERPTPRRPAAAVRR
jgi:hypothetical protein